MATLQVEIPERLAEEIAEAVGLGWFASEGEVARFGLTEFIRRDSLHLREEQQHEDIRWALASKSALPRGQGPSVYL